MCFPFVKIYARIYVLSALVDGIITQGAFPSVPKLGPTIEETRRRTNRKRIIGGSPVSGPDAYPFFVNWEGCGGTLIAPTVVLTAGHCPIERLGEAVHINAYKYHKFNTRGSAVHFIKEAIVHPDYKEVNMFGSRIPRYDYQMLILTEPVLHVKPLKVNFDHKLKSKQTLKVIGLGISEKSWGMEDKLREVKISYMSSKVCNDTLFPWYDEETMFCTGTKKGGKGLRMGVCSGDSGGPIFSLDKNGKPKEIVGLVSWGDYDCKKYDVYAPTASVADWIKSFLNNTYM